MPQAKEDDIQARHSHLTDVLKVGDDLIQADNFGKEKIQERTDEINGQWANLTELSNYRRKRLNEAVDFYQVGGFMGGPWSNAFPDLCSKLCQKPKTMEHWRYPVGRKLVFLNITKYRKLKALKLHLPLEGIAGVHQNHCNLWQFFADADDVDTWMLDTLRLVSSEDVGRDEASVQSLLKKHKVQHQQGSLNPQTVHC